MIKITNLKKSLGDNIVLNNLNLEIKENTIFGLVGINGAGKSTLLRLLSGVYNADEGNILIDNERVFENIQIKKNIFFLSDDPYVPINSTASSLIDFYSSFYTINKERFINIINKFKLDCTKKINNYSKGMRRQLFIALALAIAPKYLFLDEAFDGLDPLARLIFKKELLDISSNQSITVIISSHSLRELEDICDYYGLLDGGSINNYGDIENNKVKYFKYQIAFDHDVFKENFDELNLLSFNKVGRIIKIIVTGDEKDCLEKINKLNPILIDKINIDFEELFIIQVENKESTNND